MRGEKGEELRGKCERGGKDGEGEGNKENEWEGTSNMGRERMERSKCR